MAEYQVKHVQDFVMSSNGTEQDIPNATGVMNRMSQEGWAVHSVVPGTNAQTYGGLFITFVRG